MKHQASYRILKDDYGFLICVTDYRGENNFKIKETDIDKIENTITYKDDYKSYEGVPPKTITIRADEIVIDKAGLHKECFPDYVARPRAEVPNKPEPESVAGGAKLEILKEVPNEPKSEAEFGFWANFKSNSKITLAQTGAIATVIFMVTLGLLETAIKSVLNFGIAAVELPFSLAGMTISGVGLGIMRLSGNEVQATERKKIVDSMFDLCKNSLLNLFSFGLANQHEIAPITQKTIDPMIQWFGAIIENEQTKIQERTPVRVDTIETIYVQEPGSDRTRLA